MLAGTAKLATSYGINVAGYLTAESGVGTAARGYIQGLRQAGIPVALNNFEVGVSSRKSERVEGEFAQNNPYPINLICVNADQLPAFVEKFSQEYFAGKYNIGVWWWELPEFPQYFWSSFRWFDEIWAGSRFIQHALADCSPVPVVYIPPVVAIPNASLVERENLGLPAHEFLFLFMFDFLSAFERKNPLALIRSFRKAFTTSEPVRLVLKCINSESAPEKLAQMKAAIGDARVTLMDHYLSRIETTSLVAACDAYASLHRAEGLGLPLVEAMLLRKPVIATGWSGNIDFMTAENSWLLPYNLVANEHPAGPYEVAQIWSEADEHAAASAMREIFQNREAASLRAARGAVDAAAHFGSESVAASIRARMTVIESFHPDFENRQNSAKMQPGDHSIDESGAPAPYMIDALVAQQLQMITGVRSDNGLHASSKHVLRKLLMPLVEKAGYLNAIYAQLFHYLFQQYGNFRARIDLIDSRTRRHIATSDARIKELERQMEELRKCHSDSQKPNIEQQRQ